MRSVLVWIYLIKRQRRKTWFLYWERAHCSIFRVSALQSQSWMEIRSWHKIGDDMMVHCDTSITEESEGQVTRTVTLFVQSPDHPIVTFSLSVVIHFSAKSPENNVNLMIPPFTAAWLRFLFGKFLLTCCGLWKTEKHVDNNKILQPLATDWCSPGKMYISTQSFDEKFQGTRKKTRKLKSPNT